MRLRFDDELPLPEKRTASAKARLASAPRIEAAANAIALTMIVTFLVTFAYLHWRHRGPEISPVAAPAAADAQTIQLPGQASADRDSQKRTATPPAGIEAGLVPVSLRIRYVRGDNRIEGTIESLSAKPLSIVLVGQNREGDETARLSIQLNPLELKVFDADTGMELESGGQVLAQSQGYQDRAAPIP
jgi:hypothetical protein